MKLFLGLIADKKREAYSNPIPSQAAKKPKPEQSSSLSFNYRKIPPKVPTSSSPSLVRTEPWEETAIEVSDIHVTFQFGNFGFSMKLIFDNIPFSFLQVEAIDLVNSIMEAEGNSNEEEKIESILCGSVKQLRIANGTQRNKIELLTLSLLYLAKWRPYYFNTELLVDALLSLLKRDTSPSFKGKSVSNAALACNLLLAGWQDERNWPDLFIKVFIEDSIGERIWVDRDECQGFVENILTAFNTKIPTKSIIHNDGSTGISSSSGAASSPSIVSLGILGIDEEGSVDSDVSQGGLMRSSGNVEQQQVFSIQ